MTVAPHLVDGLRHLPMSFTRTVRVVSRFSCALRTKPPLRHTYANGLSKASKINENEGVVHVLVERVFEHT